MNNYGFHYIPSVLIIQIIHSWMDSSVWNLTRIAPAISQRRHRLAAPLGRGVLRRRAEQINVGSETAAVWDVMGCLNAGDGLRMVYDGETIGFSRKKNMFK